MDSSNAVQQISRTALKDWNDCASLEDYSVTDMAINVAKTSLASPCPEQIVPDPCTIDLLNELAEFMQNELIWMVYIRAREFDKIIDIDEWNLLFLLLKTEKCHRLLAMLIANYTLETPTGLLTIPTLHNCTLLSAYSVDQLGVSNVILSLMSSQQCSFGQDNALEAQLLTLHLSCYYQYPIVQLDIIKVVATPNCLKRKYRLVVLLIRTWNNTKNS